jgi:hypothetical protein
MESSEYKMPQRTLRKKKLIVLDNNTYCTVTILIALAIRKIFDQINILTTKRTICAEGL